jgi:hypothetical protein
MHTFQPTLVINDGTTEAMAMHDLNLNDNIDVARFNSLLVKPVVALGAANVLLDHVVKSKDDEDATPSAASTNSTQSPAPPTCS